MFKSTDEWDRLTAAVDTTPTPWQATTWQLIVEGKTQAAVDLVTDDGDPYYAASKLDQNTRHGMWVEIGTYTTLQAAQEALELALKEQAA